MGEVDRAHDMSLGRDVAIKVLPDGWLDDQDRRARFDREARTLAALNHPHIASIYGVTEAGRMRGLVLELVDGRTLEEVVLAGLTVPAALSIAAQIALALEAAHEKGIIHRDLKPANIKVSASGAVKVLDFGLARLDRQELEGGAAANLTVTGTRVGLIVGTAAYMSPEQARGAPVDKRTDIWAFGCVVYELLTGTRAFAGATLSDTVAAVLEHEPSWEALPPTTPQSIRRLLQRCLRKDRSSRVHDIADARIEIQEAIANTPHPASSASGRSRPIRGTAAIPWLVAAAAAGTLLVDRIMDPSPAPTRAVTRLELDMPPGVTAGGQTSTLTLSPDGATAAYIGVADGLRRICVRRFDQFEAKAMPGTERAQTCFFSPDSSRVGFITVERTIKILSLADGLVVPLAGDADYTAGGAWGGDGRITFGRAGALWQLPATGGSASPLTTLDAGKGEVLHAAPAVVDGGRAILFMNMTGTRRDSQRIESVTVGSGERRSILGPGSLPMYSSGGHLVFFRDRALLAASFDATALQVTGPAVRVVEDLALSVEGDPYVAISSVGTLVYRAAQNARRRVVWVGRDGREEPLIQATGSFSAPRLSRDGRYLAVHTSGDLWIQDNERSTFSPLTSEDTAGNSWPVWSADGRHVVFRTRTGLRRTTTDGSNRAETFAGTAVTDYPTSVSADGTLAFVRTANAASGADVYVLSLTGDRIPRPVVSTPAFEGGAQFSPDGRWLAYTSDEAAPGIQFQIYIRPFPGLDWKRQVSTNGGRFPLWSRDGKELFYRDGNRMMAVSIATTPELTLSQPRRLFEQPYVVETTTLANYDVGPDGRFVMIKDESSAGRLNVVLNWMDELSRLAPRGGSRSKRSP